MKPFATSAQRIDALAAIQVLAVGMQHAGPDALRAIGRAAYRASRAGIENTLLVGMFEAAVEAGDDAFVELIESAMDELKATAEKTNARAA